MTNSYALEFLFLRGVPSWSRGSRTVQWFAVVCLCLGLWVLHIKPVQSASWVVKTPMPTAREKIAACVIDGKIYVVGGAVGENQAGLTTNERYDVAADSWTVRQPMSAQRRSLAASVSGGLCYAIGGRVNFGFDGLTTVEAYDPASDQWTRKSPMPSGRFYPATAEIDGIIYVAGGTFNGNFVLNTLESYNPATDTWTTLAPMPTARALLAAAAVNGKLYAIGGTTSPNPPFFATVEVYDPGSDTWSAAADLNTARAGHAAVVANGRIYAIGGASGFNTTSSVEEYDPTADTWTTIEPLNNARVRLAGASTGDAIFAIGGALNLSPPHPGQATIESYAVAPETFTINTGLNDAWFNIDTAGQGFFIIVYPDLGIVFLSWFTFETSLPDKSIVANLGWAGHRWFTAVGPYSGDTAVLDIEFTSGGIFDSPEPKPDQVSGGGTVTVRFSDCENGTVSYDIPSIARMDVVPITRIVPDNVALCKKLSSGQ